MTQTCLDPRHDAGGSTTIRGLLMATAALIEFAPTQAHAQALDDFLARTLVDNPTIGAARAAARAAREDIAIAQADGLPSLGLSSDSESLYGDSRTLNRQLPAPVDTQLSGKLEFELPLYRGGGVRNGVAAARARYRAAQADYDRVLGDTLTAAAAAFAAAARDQLILELHRGNVEMLEDERIEVISEARNGTANRTDIRQSEARLAGARASLVQAQAQLVSSTEELARLSGRYPVASLELNALPRLGLADTVVDADAERAPAVIGDHERSLAARYDIGVAQAALRPQLSITSLLEYRRFGGADPLLNQLGSLEPYAGWHATAGLTIRIPLFQGGGTRASVRRARDIEQRFRAQQVDTGRRSLQQLRDQRAQLDADRGRIAVLAEAIAANRDAVRGVRIDRQLGIRSTLDVLNAEQELFSSRRELAQARFAAFADAAALLNSAGRAQSLLTATAGTQAKPADSTVPARPPATVPHSSVAVAARRQSKSRAITATAVRPCSVSGLIATSFDLVSLPFSHRARAVAPDVRLDYDRSVLELASKDRRLGYDLSAFSTT